MKIPLPKDEYIKKIEVNDDGLDLEFAPRKKIALLFISINDRYWPYVKQVIEDCKIHFLPQHKVDYLIWTDIPEKDSKEYKNIKDTQWWQKDQLLSTVNYLRDTKGIQLFPTEPIEWPAPTLMRYHLFLQQEEKLKDYDYVFYLDADMRVVDKVSDEVMGEGLTAAEHPMYSLRREYVPPYEPNKESAAYIPRLGQIIEENGKPRFRPLYLAGGFQGGKTSLFIEAMQKMKEEIDKDFNNNYVAIWNDESHWNKYVFEHANPLDGHPTTILPPSYIYPDSLIKEYYEPIWGKKYEPKIITVTKPFSLSKEGATHLNEFLGKDVVPTPIFKCPVCGDSFDTQGHKVLKVVTCPGSGKAHQLDLQKL